MPVSIGNMVKKITGLLDTSDLNDWEHKFVSSIKHSTNDGARTQFLSTAQVETIEKIHDKHFA